MRKFTPSPPLQDILVVQVMFAGRSKLRRPLRASKSNRSTAKTSILASTRARSC